jgi:hypothetical protein
MLSSSGCGSSLTAVEVVAGGFGAANTREVAGNSRGSRKRRCKRFEPFGQLGCTAVNINFYQAQPHTR